ncbi:MAG: hypothetical protein JWR19_170 [Pedosphaera sp.]|nr:hypothetical protein [Pedosphaera sp.]
MNKTKHSKIGFVFGAALLSALTGCVGYVDGPRHSGVYVQPPAVYVQNDVVVQDDYVYYPGYQVYYSGSRRQYVYLEGSAWVSRPTPPRVSVDVLFASPSVRMDFHDAPSAHHATMVRTYPRNWAPPGWNHGNGNGNKEERKEEQKQDHKKDK